MLEIEISLNPYGRGENTKVIGNIYIANIGLAASPDSYDYVYMIYEPKSRFSDEVLLHGVIEGHEQSNPCSKLLKRVMEDYGDSACDVSQEYVDYWIREKV